MADLFGHGIATQPRDAKPLGKYRDRGAYFTPDNLALCICRELLALGVQPRTILEPGCGGGAFMRAAAIVWPKADVLGIDLVPECHGPGRVVQQDFFDKIDGAPFDLVLGNPTFKFALAFIRRSLTLINDGGHVAFLLRAALAAGRRKGLYDRNPLWRYDPVVPRPSFTGGKTDKAQEYSSFIWKDGHKGDFTGRRLVWKDAK